MLHGHAATVGHYEFVELHVDRAYGREIRVHRLQSANLFRHGVNRRHFSVHRSAHGDEQLVEGINGLGGLAMDRLADFADAHFGIERHLDGSAGRHAQGHGDGKSL